MSAGLLVAVLFAGAAGAVLRHRAASGWAARRPWRARDGIAVVNVAGAFALGVVTTAVSNEAVRLVVATGLLGGFTTFSTWMVDAATAGRGPVARDLALQVGFGFAAALAGLATGRLL